MHSAATAVPQEANRLLRRQKDKDLSDTLALDTTYKSFLGFVSKEAIVLHEFSIWECFGRKLFITESHQRMASLGCAQDRWTVL